MKHFSLILILIGIYFCVFSQPKVGYFIPKKIITVTAPFTIIETKKFQVFPDKEDQLINTVVVAKVDGDILVESKMYQDVYTTLDLEPLGKAGKSFNFEIGYDSGGNGTITSINGSQQPVTSDIIKGTVNLVGGIVKLVANIFAAADGTTKPVFREDVREQKVVEKRTITLEAGKTFTPLIIKPTLVFAGAISASVKVEITENAIQHLPTAPAAATPSGFQLQYRVPSEHHLVVTVLNNQLVKEQTVIDGHIFVPQTGVLTFLDIPILKKKKTIEIAFDPTTGNLSKYSLKKESQLKDVVDNTKSSLDDISEQVKTLKADAATKKKEEDDKDKTYMQAENDRLTLENSKLELLIDQQKLKDQINATKQASNPPAEPAAKAAAKKASKPASKQN